MNNFFKLGTVLIVLNEIRGVVMAGPVFYHLWRNGGTLMAVWLGFCLLLGLVLSVAVPALVLKRLQWRTAK